ncbi:DUF4212 domain-containing protein [Paucibacter sp. AS339]|uniref:DUF4212 domain-containing protein n=1 Tax=Paucibacter hankyongi TaxID=3133434 RepID=UPI0030A3AA62
MSTQKHAADAPQPNPNPDPGAAPSLEAYWRRSRRLSAGLLLVWAVVTFGGTYFARELSFSFFGWPFSFWLAAQGALLVYCLIIAYHAYAMRKLDAAYSQANDSAREG